MPSWFWDPPNALVAVGYSPYYHNSGNAFEEAFFQASWLLFLDQNCEVKGDLQLLVTPYGRMMTDNSLSPQFDDFQFEKFLQRVVRLDSFAIPGVMNIALVGLRKHKISKELITSPTRDPKGFPISGRGTSAQLYKQNNAWFYAEIGAREDLAMSFFKIEHEEVFRKLARGTEHQGQTTIYVSVKMRNVHTFARRVDPRTGIISIWVTGDVWHTKN